MLKVYINAKTDNGLFSIKKIHSGSVELNIQWLRNDTYLSTRSLVPSRNLRKKRKADYQVTNCLMQCKFIPYDCEYSYCHIYRQIKNMSKLIVRGKNSLTGGENSLTRGDNSLTGGENSHAGSACTALPEVMIQIQLAVKLVVSVSLLYSQLGQNFLVCTDISLQCDLLQDFLSKADS